MSRVRILERYCKSCGLCITVCPQHALQIMTNRLNEQGVHPAGPVAEAKCTGCGRCFLICPDAAIEIEEDTEDTAEPSIATRQSGRES